MSSVGWKWQEHMSLIFRPTLTTARNKHYTALRPGPQTYRSDAAVRQRQNYEFPLACLRV